MQTAGIEDSMTLGEALKVAAVLFGGAAKVNIFRQHGLWHVGRFLDSGFYEDGPNKGRPVTPWHRSQEVFGVAPTLRDAFRFALDVRRVYSGAGGTRGLTGEARGARPVMDDKNRIIGWETGAGIFSKSFPSSRIVTR
jgi:hypothetical protein